MTGELAGLSPAVSGFLMIAAGAAFMDRIGEAFIGREAPRAEILVLPVSSGFAGVAGLILVGAATVGAPFAEVTGLHTAFMGGLGLGVLAVYSIAACYIQAGSSSYPSARSSPCLCRRGGAAACPARHGPDAHPLGPPYAAASLLSVAAFLLWLGITGDC